MFKRLRRSPEARGNSISRKLFAAFALAAVALSASACSAPGYDPSTAIGKAGILDETNIALSNGNCALALETIQPLYNSSSTDNQVRLLMASAYACFAKISLFPLIANLGDNATSLGGSGFWSLMAKTFPSVSPSADRVVEAAGLGMDALQAILVPGQVIVPTNEFNTSTGNPGSILVSDRTSDANLYLFFMTLSAIGGLENRNGDPNPNNSYNKQVPLPWQTATAVNMATDGCEFSSAVVNMIDTLGATVSLLPSNVQSGANDLLTVFNQAVGDACNYGCTDTVPSGAQGLIYNADGGWVASGCTVTTACTSFTAPAQICPQALRDRTACKAVASDQVSCAAAGIVNMVNHSVMGWQGP